MAGRLRTWVSRALLVAAIPLLYSCGGGGGGGSSDSGSSGSGGSPPPTRPAPPATTVIPAFVTGNAQFIGTPTGTAIADLDGDGLDDLVVITTDFFLTGPGSDRVYVFYSRPNGSTDVKFAATAGTPVNTAWTWSVAACDADGDGKKELLIGYGFGDLTIYKFAMDGTPVLSSTIPGVRANRIVCADLDGDGLSDVVTSGTVGVNVQVLMQMGGQLVERGTFPSDVFAITGGQGIYKPLFEIGDIDGDGKPDIIFFAREVSTLKRTINAYVQTAPGQFGPPITLDFPRDNNDDIPANGLAFGQLQPGTRNLAVSLGGNAPSAKLVITTHGVNGQTLSSVSVATADIPTDIHVRDINGDGRPDIAVFHNGFGSAGVYYQNADGTFTNEQFLFTFFADQALGPNVIAFGDLEPDGKLDIAVADQTAIFIYLQQ